MASKPEPRRGPARGKRAAEAVAGMAEVAAEEQAQPPAQRPRKERELSLSQMAAEDQENDEALINGGQGGQGGDEIGYGGDDGFGYGGDDGFGGDWPGPEEDDREERRRQLQEALLYAADDGPEELLVRILNVGGLVCEAAFDTNRLQLQNLHATREQTEVLRELSRQLGKGAGGGGKAGSKAGSNQIFVVGTAEQIKAMRDEARKLLPQHVFSITVFPANGELDKVCVLMVPGARDIAAAKSKAADYHELRKLIQVQCTYQRNQMSVRAMEALAKFFPNMNEERKAAILKGDLHLVDKNGDFPLATRKCLLYAIKRVADPSYEECEEMTLPAASVAYVLSVMELKMRGAVKMFQAHEQVDLVTVAADGTTTSTKVVFSTFLEERIPKLKAMRQQQVSWLEAPSED